MDSETREAFSKIVKRYERALRAPEPRRFDATIAVIDQIREHWSVVGLERAGNELSVVEHWYTRLAAGITEWATHQDTALTEEQLKELVRKKNEFVYIFAASGYRNMRHLGSLVDRGNSDGTLRLDGQKAVVLFALLGLDDLDSQLLDIAMRLPHHILLHLFLGWLNQRAVVTERGEYNRGILLTSSSLIEAAELTDREIGLAVNSYMYSSYASHPQKHDYKATLNHFFAKQIKGGNIVPAKSKVRRVDRPTILVVHERFTSTHAMFRSYAPLIRALRHRFHVTALVETNYIDAQSEELFDSVHKIDSEAPKNLATISSQVKELAPDIIYYTSLGMLHWTVMMSNLRLAPIQVMTQGHPATSRSDVIDYVFVSPMEGDPTAIHSERILMGEKPVVFASHLEFPDDLPEPVAPSEREVRIAVNSKVMKLSHRLLDICARLQKESNIPVRFNFFPGEMGFWCDGISAMIKARIPDAIVSPVKTYESFLREILRCDMALSSFPFGNTNSTVDTCLLGLPTVANFGPETPAQTDRMVLTAAGYPEWLVCDGDEAYFQTALKLIEDPALRVSVTEGLSRDLVRSRIAPKEIALEQPELADMLWWAYSNHEEIQASEQRLFRWADCCDQG